MNRKTLIVLLITLIITLFALLPPVALASKPERPIRFESLSSVENPLSTSPQITFTPVASVYLPIIVNPPPGCEFYEPNNVPEQATIIKAADTQTHCIKPETDVDWMRFSVDAESQMTLSASDLRGDLELRLYDSHFNELDFSYSWPDRPAQINYDCGRSSS